MSYDETRLKTISARFPARIEKLYVNAIGIQVKQGDHLALVYSQDLLAAQSDLVSSLKFSAGSDATQGPREQLRQWGFSEADISSIESSLAVQEFLEIDAPIGGTIVSKSIHEGDHVEMGANFFTIADLTNVWITLDVYESDLPWVHYGQEISISAEGSPGRKFTGIVSLIYPDIDPLTRTAKVRVFHSQPRADSQTGTVCTGDAIRYSQCGGRSHPTRPHRQVDQSHAPGSGQGWPGPMRRVRHGSGAGQGNGTGAHHLRDPTPVDPQFVRAANRQNAPSSTSNNC